MRKEGMSGVFDFLRAGKSPRTTSRAPVEDLYGVLGVRPGASYDEIRAAYRELAKRYHPDRYPGDPGAQARFQELSRASGILTNPDSRRAYDAAREAARTVEKPVPKPVYPALRPGEKPTWHREGRPESQRASERPSAVAPRPTGRPVNKLWTDMFGEPPKEGVQEESIFAFLKPKGTPPQAAKASGQTRAFSSAVPSPGPGDYYRAAQRLPLEGMLNFIRQERLAPGFAQAGVLSLGPIAGAGGAPAEADLANLLGLPLDALAAYADRYGLEQLWRQVLYPMAEKLVLAIDSLKPVDLPGVFYVDWDPSGRLELLYRER